MGKSSEGWDSMAPPPVGVGPVLAGRHDGKPCYYADLLFADGTTKRLFWEKKQARGADRAAKNQGYFACTQITAKLRERGAPVARIYDEASFDALAAVLAGQSGASQAAA